MLINDIDPSILSRNSDERELIIKEFIRLNPLMTDDWYINELYNNMYNNDYIKMFAQQYLVSLRDMQEFFYKFVHTTGVKLSLNDDINSLPRIIEMLWDGIHGWQW
jgi:hypothetical protein